MNCFFCDSEIHQDAILKGPRPSAAAKEGYPLEYECEKCVHVWLTEECADEMQHDDWIREHRSFAGQCIRKRCEDSDKKGLDKPLSLGDLRQLMTDGLKSSES